MTIKLKESECYAMFRKYIGVINTQATKRAAMAEAELAARDEVVLVEEYNKALSSLSETHGKPGVKSINFETGVVEFMPQPAPEKLDK